MSKKSLREEVVVADEEEQKDREREREREREGEGEGEGEGGGGREGGRDLSKIRGQRRHST